jgi:hypothetical protein
MLRGFAKKLRRRFSYLVVEGRFDILSDGVFIKQGQQFTTALQHSRTLVFVAVFCRLKLKRGRGNHA